MNGRPRYDRLNRLAEFLEGLKPRLFDFGTIMDLGDNPPRKALEMGGGCGTVGCAIGWLPAAFPRTFKWDIEGARADVVHRRWGEMDFDAAREFFNIDSNATNRLFMPGSRASGFSGLSGNTTPKRVAANIRRWVEEDKRERGLVVA